MVNLSVYEHELNMIKSSKNNKSALHFHHAISYDHGLQLHEPVITHHANRRKKERKKVPLEPRYVRGSNKNIIATFVPSKKSQEHESNNIIPVEKELLGLHNKNMNQIILKI